MTGRISILAKTFPAPSETFVVDHVVGMAARDWKVQVICRSLGPSEQLHDIVAAGVRIDTIPFEITRLERIRRRLLGLRSHGTWALGRSSPVCQALYGAEQLKDLIESFGPDLVHAHFGQMALMAAAASPGCPVVADFHGSDTTVLPVPSNWAVYRPLRHGHAVVHSEYIAARIRSHLGVEPAVVPLGVDPTVFFPAGDSLAADPTVEVLMVGRMVSPKGHLEVIRVVSQLQIKSPGRRWRITIVGDGELRAELKREAQSLAVDLCLPGALGHAQVAERMRSADLFVFPSLQPEGFGRVLIEAMASGLPIVALEGGAVREVLGGAGTILRQGDFLGLEQAIAEASQPEVAREMGAAALRRSELFPLSAMVDGYADVANRVAASDC